MRIPTRRLEQLMLEYTPYLKVPVAQDYARDIIAAFTELIDLRTVCESAYPVVRYALLFHTAPCAHRDEALRAIEYLSRERLTVQPKEALPHGNTTL